MVRKTLAIAALALPLTAVADNETYRSYERIQFANKTDSGWLSFGIYKRECTEIIDSAGVVTTFGELNSPTKTEDIVVCYEPIDIPKKKGNKDYTATFDMLGVTVTVNCPARDLEITDTDQEVYYQFVGTAAAKHTFEKRELYGEGVILSSPWGCSGTVQPVSGNSITFYDSATISVVIEKEKEASK